jgi:3-oxoacyl-[acyl-carrier protein] reductase
MTDARVALVTGARKGIGLEIARFLVARGYRVIGCSREAAGWSDENYEHHRLDVADEGAVRALAVAIRRKHGGLDVAVNNAGIASMNAFFLVPTATVERVMRTNFLGTWIVSREAAKLMRSRGRGRIVNLSSVAVPLNLEGEAAYIASKSAVEALTKSLSFELGTLGITVNAIGPTPILTDLLRGVPQDKIRALVDRQAVKRLGEPRDVLNVLDFLIRPESDFVTGQVIYLGGVGA